MIVSMVGFGKARTTLVLDRLSGDFRVRGGINRVRSVVALAGSGT